MRIVRPVRKFESVATLQQKVKNALDEARILMLGTQVLLGFQYRSFFENGFDKLPAADKLLKTVGLFALLTSVAVLFLPGARHRIVNEGNDTERFHRFTLNVMPWALGPFAIALAIDLGIAADQIAGPLCGAAAAVATLIAALAFWYTHFARRDKTPHQEPEDKVEKTKLDQRIVHVLTETRVVLPGAQALLGFQLAMVMMEPFAGLPQTAKLVHLASLAFIALATVVLMSPAAYHRIVERGEDTERFHTFASRMVVLAMALLAPGFCGELFVVLTRMGFHRGAWIVSAVTLALMYAAWFGVMLALRQARPHVRQKTA